MQEVYKIFVTIPEAYTDELIEAMSHAGAGVVGNYTHCAFITKGFGNYLPSENAAPFIGSQNKMSREPEDKVEMICPKDRLVEVVKAIKEIHPYETPTIDVLDIMFYN